MATHYRRRFFAIWASIAWHTAFWSHSVHLYRLLSFPGILKICQGPARWMMLILLWSITKDPKENQCHFSLWDAWREKKKLNKMQWWLNTWVFSLFSSLQFKPPLLNRSVQRSLYASPVQYFVKKSRKTLTFTNSPPPVLCEWDFELHCILFISCCLPAVSIMLLTFSFFLFFVL